MTAKVLREKCQILIVYFWTKPKINKKKLNGIEGE